MLYRPLSYNLLYLPYVRHIYSCCFVEIHNKCRRPGLCMENKLLLSVAWFLRMSYVPSTQIEFGWVFRILTLGIRSQKPLRNISELKWWKQIYNVSVGKNFQEKIC